MDWPEKAWEAGKLLGAAGLGVLSLLKFRHRKRHPPLSIAERSDPDVEGVDLVLSRVLSDLRRRVAELEQWKRDAEGRREERVREIEEVRSEASRAAGIAERAERDMIAIRGTVTLELQGIQSRIDALILGLARPAGKMT